MMLTVDNLASRYGLLPSEVLARADTYDLEVLGASVKWEHHKRQESERKVPGMKGPPPIPDLSQEELLNIVTKAKKKKK